MIEKSGRCLKRRNIYQNIYFSYSEQYVTFLLAPDLSREHHDTKHTTDSHQTLTITYLKIGLPNAIS